MKEVFLFLLYSLHISLKFHLKLIIFEVLNEICYLNNRLILSLIAFSDLNNLKLS